MGSWVRCRTRCREGNAHQPLSIKTLTLLHAQSRTYLSSMRGFKLLVARSEAVQQTETASISRRIAVSFTAGVAGAILKPPGFNASAAAPPLTKLPIAPATPRKH